MSETHQDRIDAYLRGEMSPAQKSAFEHDLTTDKALRQEYELTRLISASLGHRKRKLEMMAEWENHVAGEDTPRIPKIKKRIWWTVASTAAAACLVAGFFVLRPNTEPSYPEDALAYAEVAESCAPIPEAVYEEDWAADLCPAYEDDDLSSGVAYASVNPSKEFDYAEEAIADESTVEETPEQQYENTWLQINRLIERGKTDEALRLLADYKDKPGAHREDARKLYKRLTGDN